MRAGPSRTQQASTAQALGTEEKWASPKALSAGGRGEVGSGLALS